MPNYEYRCVECENHVEYVRLIEKRNDPAFCICGESAERVITAPALSIWNSELAFPNMSSTGDGTQSFASKDDYNVHLKENNWAESSTDAPKISKPHHTKIMSF